MCHWEAVEAAGVDSIQAPGVTGELAGLALLGPRDTEEIATLRTKSGLLQGPEVEMMVKNEFEFDCIPLFEF